MEQSTIENRVFSVIAEVLKVDKNKLSLHSKFKEDLGADSLDLLSLMMAFEEEFKSSISDDEATKMICIGDTVVFIMNRPGIVEQA